MQAAGPLECWYPHTKQTMWHHMPDECHCKTEYSLPLHCEIRARAYTNTILQEDVAAGM